MNKDEELVRHHAKLVRLQELRQEYGFLFYRPYAKQGEFHAWGATKRERLLMAGNKLGKTYSAGFEVTFHATGLYPDWWAGYRFTHQNRWWAGSVTSELTRDGMQRVLLGNIGRWGTGCIPKDRIVEIKRARGVPDAVETVLVRHVCGEVSQITFKAYSDGREAWQAEDLDGVWFDEEPPEDIYVEGVTRTNNTGGPVFMTFTPLLGMSNVVMRFLEKAHPDRQVTNMTIDDVEHYSVEQKRRILDSYPPHEREARAMGVPMLGSGRVYPIAEEILKEDPLEMVPEYWPQIIGIDFGWEHPTACVGIAHDPAGDVVHVLRAYKQKEATPLIHAAAIRPWGAEWIPIAWPHDGYQHDKGSGKQLAQTYRDLEMAMLNEHAQFPDKRGNGVNDGTIEILQRMQTGRLKVSRMCADWFEEMRMYHRKEGKIIKERDDLMDATRYAIMMLRHAIPAEYKPPKPDRYAQGGRQAIAGETSWMSA